MATKITKIQTRRDTAVNWTAANPTLSTGEIGFEYDTYKFKIGYGNLDWENLPYFSGEGIIPPALHEVLSSGNAAPGYDAFMAGMHIGAITDEDGKVVNGGLIGDILPGNKFVQFVNDVSSDLSIDSNNNLGLLLSSRQSSRRPAQYLTDLDFSDDLALIAESIKNAETQ